MNLRQLKYFLSVVDTGNMTRAAEHLNVAQTALGMQIKQLEESLGVTLLVRHSRGVEPTKAGSLLRERALEILKLVEQTRNDVAGGTSGNTETIRLGITPALMLIVGTEIVLTARERLPQVSLSLVEAMSHVLAETLTRGEADFILCYDVPDLPQFSRIPILQDDLVLVTLPQGPHAPADFVFRSAKPQARDARGRRHRAHRRCEGSARHEAGIVDRLRGALDFGDEEPRQPRRRGKRAALFFRHR